MRFSEDQCREFANAADPHQWLLTAESLHDQAMALYRQRNAGGRLVRRDSAGLAVAWDNTNRATHLLCAFALENAIKSFLVYEHPEWVSGGILDRELCSHRLVALSEKSELIPHHKRDRWVLTAFEEGNESWMRYPCGRRADDLQDQVNMPDRLWAGYLRVMRGYGNKLVTLLRKGWAGPHGAGGGWWEITGECLDGGSPLQQNRIPPAFEGG